MLRHHLPALKKVRSALFPQFVRLRSSRLGDTTGRYGLSQSTGPIHNPMMKTKPGPYSHREVEVSSPGNATFQPTYELGQLQSVQTFIGKGRKKGTSDDKIHLTHEIRQQQVRTD